MLAWSPLLVQKTEIHALGFVLRKLQLNRHRDAEVAPHSHPYSQLILFLSGEGLQTINGRRHAATGGDLFVLPPHVMHGFSIVAGSRPLCLVLDFETDQERQRLRHRFLPRSELNDLHALLARVPAKGRLRLGDYASVLAVVSALLEPRRGTPPALPRAPGLDERVRALLAETSIANAASLLGYHRDHLTRKLKAQTGLGLRAQRDRLRLEAAQGALHGLHSVSEAAQAAGFEDANYFSRWFKAQTGVPPRLWRRSTTA